MKAKFGFIHDYDLKANEETSSKGITCAVCGTYPVLFQWSDYAGEAMCHTCGCPYQLKWGSEEQEAEGKYPYLRLREEFLPVAREYWQEKKAFVTYGIMLDGHQGIGALNSWLLERHPGWLKKEGDPS